VTDPVEASKVDQRYVQRRDVLKLFVTITDRMAFSVKLLSSLITHTQWSFGLFVIRCLRSTVPLLTVSMSLAAGRTSTTATPSMGVADEHHLVMVNVNTIDAVEPDGERK
jgi:hypothetical protein